MILSGKHRARMRFALRVANDAPLDQNYRIGCVIAKGHSTISSGYNHMDKTHPKARIYEYPYPHAELIAMIGVDEAELNSSVAYVARRKRNGKPGLAKPCSVCLKYLRKYGVKKVYYTTNDPEEVGVMDLRSRK